MLEVINLSRFGLKPASLTLATGECVAVRGPSGAGKTLLLRAIADLDPNEGQVSLDGLDREAVSAPEWRRQVAYLPAEPGWWADGVGEHFSTWDDAVPLLARLGLPEEARDWPVSRCSTGERQRLALVRALVTGPRVLLLDEPTSALDVAKASVVEALIAERCAAGLSVLWVTHDDAQARVVACRWLSVEAGEVREVRGAMTGYIALSYWDVAFASLFVLVNAALSVALDLGIHRQTLVAAVRMVVQLALMGLVLVALFSTVSPLFTGLAMLGMALFAGREIAARQERPLAGWWSYGLGAVCITTASMLVTIFALTVSLQAHPWYDPRYAVPLLGMILGNAMTGISLGIHGMTTGLKTRQAAVEAQLMLGADRRTALGPVVRQALRSALMPIVNSMSATGIVSLPGMMTGQILGGVSPGDAVKYQILIMFLIAGGTGIGAVAAVMGCAYRLTDNRHRLRLDRLAPARK